MFFTNTSSQPVVNHDIKINLNEVYFGKSTELLKAEGILDSIRAPRLGKYSDTLHINSSPEVLEFNRLMEDIFGFGLFSLYINNIRNPNAGVMPVDFYYDYNRFSNNIIADKKTFKFKKEKNFAVVCYINSGLIFNPNFTTEECMASILHEIGHCFNTSVNQQYTSLTHVMIAYRFINRIFTDLVNLDLEDIAFIPIKTNAYQSITGKLMRKWREEDGVFAYCWDLMIYIYNISQNVINTAVDLLNIATLGMFTLVFYTLGAGAQLILAYRHPFSAIMNSIDASVAKANERFADNFATMYGYGAAQASALAKFESYEGDDGKTFMKHIDKTFIGKLIHTIELPGIILITAGDEHPQGLDRAKDQVAMLKTELEKADLDPRMKKRIQKDIKDIEQSIKLYTTVMSKDDSYAARKAYNRIFLDKFTSSDTHDSEKFARFKGYDKAYNMSNN